VVVVVVEPVAPPVPSVVEPVVPDVVVPVVTVPPPAPPPPEPVLAGDSSEQAAREAMHDVTEMTLMKRRSLMETSLAICAGFRAAEMYGNLRLIEKSTPLRPSR
jgi:hypothetical protein